MSLADIWCSLFLHGGSFSLSIDVTIKFPEGPLNLEKYRGTGQQPGEELLPADAPSAAGKQ